MILFNLKNGMRMELFLHLLRVPFIKLCYLGASFLFIFLRPSTNVLLIAFIVRVSVSGT